MMTKHLILLLFLLICTSSILAQDNKLEKTITVHKVCQNAPELTLESITINSDETRISFSANITKELIWEFWEPGTRGAFYISNTSNTKRWDLIDIEGIRFGKSRYLVGMHYFTLVFPALPMDVKRINLIEGDVSELGVNAGMKGFNFYNIKLDN